MTVLERVDLDAISRDARDVHLGRVVLTVVAAVFFGLGFAAARVFLAVAWCGVAVRAGWRAGRVHGPAGTG